MRVLVELYCRRDVRNDRVPRTTHHIGRLLQASLGASSMYLSFLSLFRASASTSQLCRNYIPARVLPMAPGSDSPSEGVLLATTLVKVGMPSTMTSVAMDVHQPFVQTRHLSITDTPVTTMLTTVDKMRAMTLVGRLRCNSR